jgi:hypothetical protein
MRQKVQQLKIRILIPFGKDSVELGGETKNGDYGKFVLDGERRISLVRNRFSIGSCVDIELHEDGITIARMQRAIDTIEESD